MIYDFNPVLGDINILFCFILFSIFIFLIYTNRKGIIKLIREIDKKTLTILALIFILSMVLRLSVFTPSPYLGEDSIITQNAAENIADFKSSSFTYYCINENNMSDFCTLVYWRDPIWPMLLGTVYLITGPGYPVSYFLSSLLSSFAVFTLFFIAYLLFRRKDIGVYAAFIFSISIFQVYWASNDTNHATSVLFVSLFILSYLYYGKKQDKKSLYLALSSLSVCAVSRPENILFIPFFMGYEIWKKRCMKLDRSLLIFIAIISFLLMPKLVFFFQDATSYFGHNDFSFYGKSIFGHLYYNFENYSTILLHKGYQPYVLAFTAILGVVALTIKEKKKAGFLIAWLLTIFLPFMFSFILKDPGAGPYRLFLTTHLPFIIFSAYGIYCLTKKISKNIIILTILLMCLPYVRTYQFEIQDNQSYIHSMKFKFEIIPKIMEKTAFKDCYFIVDESSHYMSLYTTIKSIEVNYVLKNPEVIEDMIKKKECFIYGGFEPKYLYDNIIKDILRVFKTKKVYNTSYKNYGHSDIDITYYAYNITGIKEKW